MSRFHRAGLLACIVLVLAGPSSPAIEQRDIDKAIAAGVKALRAIQTDDGSWPAYRAESSETKIGATALAGLTLLECGGKPDDREILRAAEVVRKASIKLTYNYSIALAILFFDRLGDANDVPLIESLTVRLLAGQTSTGGWHYRSPSVPEEEVRRLQGKLAERKELVGRSRPPRVGGAKRSVQDLSPEIQQQLTMLKRMNGMLPEMRPDNSNTQFATLALWIARRYGLPVADALKRVETRFRTSQNADGGWGYHDTHKGFMGRSSAGMTCAGLLGLAVADGDVSERAREQNPRAKAPHDINKDSHVRKGLVALGTAIGKTSEKIEGGRGAAAPQIGGRTFYFLWSLERVAVALDLKTIGKKDWYTWGAEILLANQQADGTWQGNYAECGADTCFALLFLKRANLVPDLTTQLTGRVQDPGERVLKPGELREGIARMPNGEIGSGVEGKEVKPKRDGEYAAQTEKKPQPQPKTEKTEPRPVAKSAPPPTVPDRPRPSRTDTEGASSSPTARMAADLAKSRDPRFSQLLHNLRFGKGPEFTEALALAIPQMSGQRQKETREALAKRLERMKDSSLKNYLSDELLEIRIAAATACAEKGSKALIPDLIPLVKATRGGVAEAAHQALKKLSGQDFGPKPYASREERVQAARQWTEWWNKQDHK